MKTKTLEKKTIFVFKSTKTADFNTEPTTSSDPTGTSITLTGTSGIQRNK